MNVEGSNSDIIGKKIFFLFPSAVVQNRIIGELIQQEYEVYIAKNKDNLKRVLRQYPDSIIFVDVNEHMAENEWEMWIRGIMDAPDTKDVSIGIVTSNENDQAKQKYQTTLKVPCGYTVINYDLEKIIGHLISVLQEVGAKGRRKYIRAIIDRVESNTSVNLSIDGNYVNGRIKDISAVGISCTFENNLEIPKNTLLKDIQVRLQTHLLKAEGIVFGSRMEGTEKTYVILFTQRIDPEVRAKIRKYIQQHMQNKMDSQLDT